MCSHHDVRRDWSRHETHVETRTTTSTLSDCLWPQKLGSDRFMNPSNAWRRQNFLTVYDLKSSVLIAFWDLATHGDVKTFWLFMTSKARFWSLYETEPRTMTSKLSDSVYDIKISVLIALWNQALSCKNPSFIHVASNDFYLSALMTRMQSHKCNSSLSRSV